MPDSKPFGKEGQHGPPKPPQPPTTRNGKTDTALPIIGYRGSGSFPGLARLGFDWGRKCLALRFGGRGAFPVMQQRYLSQARRLSDIATTFDETACFYPCQSLHLGECSPAIFNPCGYWHLADGRCQSISTLP